MTADTAPAPTTGHNSAAVGEVLEKDPALLFRDPEMLPALIESVEAEIAAAPVDLTTVKGREALKSLAYSIAQRKTTYDNAGKALNDGKRKEIDIVDEIRRNMRDRFDKLRDKAKAPALEWEAAEDRRKAEATRIRGLIADASRLPLDATAADVDEELAMLGRLVVTAETFGDMAGIVEEERKVATERLQAAKDRIATADADRAELQKLRAAEFRRQLEAAEKERLAQVERDKAAAAEREAQAAKDREAAKEAKAKADKAARELKAANEAKAAAERETAALRKAEASRLDAAARAAAAAAKLERNKKHRKAVFEGAQDAIVSNTNLDAEAANEVMNAILEGKIPHVTIDFGTAVEYDDGR